MMAHGAWLGWVLALCAVTLRALYGGGTTLNDHVIAAAVTGCFAIYGVLGLGALAALEGPPRRAALVALGGGAALLVPLFSALDARAELGDGPGWWLVIASQPSYAFCFWSFWVLALRAIWPGCKGARLAWPGAWLLLPLALSLWGLAWALGRADAVRTHRLPSPYGGGLRLVQLSDLHFGPLLPRHRLDRILGRSADLAPDLVVITGDLVSPFSDAPGEHDGLAEALAGLPAPVIMVPGNHDLPHWDSLRPELEAAGIFVLEDDALVLEREGLLVQVLGAGFRWTGASNELSRLLEGHPRPEAPSLRVLLCHDPRVVQAAPPDSYDLALAGHSHGGTPAAGFVGLRVSAMRLAGVLDQGFFQLPGGPLYVSEGSWLLGVPPRIGTASEITLFELGGGR
jgi:predicted MPP superfamily phosphohydrolase